MFTIGRISPIGRSLAKSKAKGFFAGRYKPDKLLSLKLLAAGCLVFFLSASTQAAEVLRLPEGSFRLDISHQVDIRPVDGQNPGIEQVLREAQDFHQARPGDLMMDFKPGPHWLRFAIANDGPQLRHAMLRVQPPHLDKIQLFQQNGIEIEAVSNEGIVRSPLVFVLNIPPRHHQLYYLRLEGEGQTLTDLTLSDFRPFLLIYRFELFSNGAGVGLLLAMAVINFAMFAVYAQVRLFLLLGLYSVCNLAAIGGSWSYFYIAQHAHSPFANPLFIAFTHASMFIAILIANEFQSLTREGYPRWNFFIRTLLWINGFAVVFTGFLPLNFSLVLMSVTLAVSATVITARPLLTYLATQDRVAFHYLFARAWVILFTTLSALVYMRLDSSLEFINLMLLIGTSVELLLLSIISAIHRQQTLSENLRHKVRIATLEGEQRGANEAMRRFHTDLMTPLSAIFGLTEMLKNSQLTPQQRDYTNNLQAASQDMLGAVENLQSRDFLASDTLTAPELLFDAKALIEDIAERHSDDGVVFHQSSSLPEQLIGDPGRLRQLLSQLLTIASHYRQNGDITLQPNWDERLRFNISYRGDKALALLHAGDMLSGLPDAAIHTRAEVVSQLNQTLGGTLRLHSLANEQSILLSLPLQAWQHDQKLPRPLLLRSRRILIVEPNRHYAWQQRQLCEQWGMTTFVAHNVRQAIALWRNQRTLRAPLHLVMISASLDKALELNQRLFREAEGARLPAPGTLFLSEDGRDITEDALGHCRLISKPVSSFTLKRLIIELLDTGGAQNEPA